MVEGKTKSGIEFVIDERIKKDARVLRLLLKIQKKGISEEEAGRALFDLIKLIFGTDENVDVFLDEVANKHDGVCDTQSLIEELKEIFAKVNAKNSSSSPKSSTTARKN